MLWTMDKFFSGVLKKCVIEYSCCVRHNDVVNFYISEILILCLLINYVAKEEMSMIQYRIYCCTFQNLIFMTVKHAN